MSKLAMRKVFDNQRLKELGFKIVLQIHDELIGECPKENAEEVSTILSDVMKHCAEPVVQVPFKCDTYIVPRWYDDDFGDIIREEYAKLASKKDATFAYEQLLYNHSELTAQQLSDYINS